MNAKSRPRKPRLYDIWAGMRRRCNSRKNYADRGIRCCERWTSFVNFAADMGEPPPGMTLDRINNDGDYEPGNCRWATLKQQCRNKRTNRLVTLNGETRCLMEWTQIFGLNFWTVKGRLNRGVPPDQAFTKPTRQSAPRYATINGETLRIAEWVRRLGVSDKTVRTRLLIGWTPEEALTRPVQKYIGRLGRS